MDVVCLSSIACHLHGWRQGLSVNLKHVCLAGWSARVRGLHVCLTRCWSHRNIPSHLAFHEFRAPNAGSQEPRQPLGPLSFVGQGFLWYCGLAGWAWLASEPQDPPASLSALGSQTNAVTPRFSYKLWESNSGPQAPGTNALLRIHLHN